jgi:hypothetical protein
LDVSDVGDGDDVDFCGTTVRALHVAQGLDAPVRLVFVISSLAVGPFATLRMKGPEVPTFLVFGDAVIGGRIDVGGDGGDSGAGHAPEALCDDVLDGGDSSDDGGGGGGGGGSFATGGDGGTTAAEGAAGGRPLLRGAAVVGGCRGGTGGNDGGRGGRPGGALHIVAAGRLQVTGQILADGAGGEGGGDRKGGGGGGGGGHVRLQARTIDVANPAAIVITGGGGGAGGDNSNDGSSGARGRAGGAGGRTNNVPAGGAGGALSSNGEPQPGLGGQDGRSTEGGGGGGGGSGHRELSVVP